jgi:glycosyltransferase involved in cell wall biosynthesis
MVVHAPYPLAETRVEREAHAALEAGFDVDVVAMTSPGEEADERAADGSRIYRLPVPRARGTGAGVVVREYLGFSTRAAGRVAALHRMRPYGVVHVHNPPDFLLAAGLVPRLRGARLVLDIHDFAPELFAMRFGARRGGRAAERALWRIEALATRFADRVVTVHEPYRRLLVARGVPEQKILVVLNSPEERLLPSVPPPDDGGHFRIVYHGTVTHHYGLVTLVEAFAHASPQLPDAVVEIYGAGDALAEVKRRASDLGVDDRIRFSDRFLDNAEILRTISGADVGVVANLGIARNAAALPTKLLEYVAIGVPVVSSNLDAVREHFDDSEMLFYEAGDARAMADALLAVARDPAAASERAARARARYDSHYRWAIYASRYVDLLNELVDPVG